MRLMVSSFITTLHVGNDMLALRRFPRHALLSRIYINMHPLEAIYWLLSTFCSGTAEAFNCYASRPYRKTAAEDESDGQPMHHREDGCIVFVCSQGCLLQRFYHTQGGGKRHQDLLEVFPGLVTQCIYDQVVCPTEDV